MPTYPYICPNCNCHEDVFKSVKDIDTNEYCLECGITMKRIITKGHGGTHGDEAAWIRDTNIALDDGFSRPVTNRTELRQREKEKGVICIG
jgi:putative FmdB family regulatory protein